MSFRECILKGKQGDRNALEAIYVQFRYLLRKLAKYKGRFDEDLYQDFCEILIRCVYTFPLG